MPNAELYQKVDGVWVKANRPYVRVGGIWTAGKAAYVKVAGQWQTSYNYDTTPPDRPEVSLLLVEDYNVDRLGNKTLKTRYIRCGVRMPSTSNDPNIRLIRVLTDYNGAKPTTQFGGTFTSTPDSNYQNEPWSEWRCNDYGVHNDTSKFTYKQWPVNATTGTTIHGDKTFHFAAWALDDAGNWSAVNQAQLYVQKGGADEPITWVKEAYINANSSGSWKSNAWQSGVLIQQKSPRSQGMWHYGQQFPDVLSPNSAIRNAQIYIQRRNDDGSANANIYLFWANYGHVGGLPNAGGTINPQQTTKIGTLAKGQGKWFDIPQKFNGDMKSGAARTLGLAWKDPDKAGDVPADYSRIEASSVNPKCGQVHLVWEDPR